MTCIVGYLDKITNKVTIGADSAGVAGLNLSIRKDVKIFRNKDFIIGCTSSFRMIQLLRFKFKPPYMDSKEIYEYMCTDFIDEVRKVFKEGGFLQKEKEVEEGGAFLVGYKDRLFCIQGDFQVGENLDGLDAVGCGSEYALGSLFANLETELSAEQKINSALKSAAYFSAGVSEPFNILATE